MMDTLMTGLAKALLGQFPGCRVYADEQVDQGLVTPCFFLSLGELSSAPLPCGLTQMNAVLEITYFPQHSGDYRSLWQAAPLLLQLTEQIPLPDGTALRGFGRYCTVEDGLLRVRVRLHLRLLSEDIGPVMETMIHRAHHTESIEIHGTRERRED